MKCEWCVINDDPCSGAVEVRDLRLVGCDKHTAEIEYYNGFPTNAMPCCAGHFIDHRNLLLKMLKAEDVDSVLEGDTSRSELNKVDPDLN
jgi:hypothetical protein